MALKFGQVLQTLDTQMEVALTGELVGVVPPERMDEAREAVHHALTKARRSWENKTLDEVFGQAKARKIRSILHEMTLD